MIVEVKRVPRRSFGILPAAQRAIGPTEIGIQDGGIEAARYGLLKLLQRLWVAALPDVLRTQVAARLSVVRIDAQRLLQLAHGFSPMAGFPGPLRFDKSAERLGPRRALQFPHGDCARDRARHGPFG